MKGRMMMEFDRRFTSVSAIIDKKSIKAAAAHLGVSAATLAKDISSLEGELGVSLFRRSGRFLLPTREGELVADAASKVGGIMGTLSQELSGRGESSMVLGVTDSALSYILLPIVSGGKGRRMRIVTGNLDDVTGMVRSYKADMAVVEGDGDFSSLSTVILDTDSLVAVVPAGSPEARRGMITLSSFLSHPLIMKDRSSWGRRQFEAMLESRNLEKPSVIMEAESTAAITRFVASGYGLSLLPRKAVENDRRVRGVTIENTDLTRALRIIWRSGEDRSEEIGWIEECYGNGKQGAV